MPRSSLSRLSSSRSPFITFERASRTAVPLLVLTLALSACGGGSDAAATDTNSADAGTSTSTSTDTNLNPTATDTLTNTASIPVSSEPCPADYRKIQIEDSPIAGATMQLSAGDALFALTMPKLAPPTSLLACFGKPAIALAQDGYRTLGDTYELRVTTKSAVVSANTSLPDLKPKITFKFAPDTLADGTTATADLSSKIKVYSPDDKGVWQALNTDSIDIAPPYKDPVSTIVISPPASGRFLVAYKL